MNADHKTSENEVLHSPDNTMEMPAPPEFDVRANRKIFSRLGIALIAILVVMYVTTYLISYIVYWFFPEIYNAGWYPMVVGTLPMYLFGIPVGLLILRKVPRGVTVRRRISFPMFLLLLIMCFGITYGGSLISNLVTRLVELLINGSYKNPLESTLEGVPIWLTTLFVAVLAPIMEELVFRKALTDRLTPYGDVVAILVPSVLFGLFHGNFYQLFYAVGVGLVFGWIYVYSGNILYSILLHMAVNFTGSVLIPEASRLLEFDSATETIFDSIAAHPIAYLIVMVSSLMVYATIICTVILLICLRKQIKEPLRRGTLPIPKGKRFSTVVCNWGMILLLLASVGLFALSMLQRQP